ncbi:MAG: TraB/GumN family protein [Thermoplasmatota archaeon]
MIEEMRPGVVVVGTAHVSAKSVEQVEATIRERKPDAVLVELDERRFEALKDPDAWQKTDIIQVLREKKQHLFLLQLYLASMQARMGRETGVAPGGEMLRAIEVADELGAEVVLIDRDVSITLKRGFASMGFWRRMRLFWNVTLDVLTPADPNEKVDVDDLLETDAITQMTEEFARFAPDIKTALIDERDAYMASHIDAQDKAGRTCVAVVGAGHCPGIQRHLAASEVPERAPLDELPTPPAISVGKVLGIGVPLLILGLFAYLGYQGYQEGNYSDFLDSIQTWVFLNGGLAALGALLAGGHLFSIIAAFIAAPITSLNPALAAGWFAGLTEAKVRTPTVGDFQAIKHMETFRDFRRNGVVRVILVTALANLGSAIATWVAGAQIVRTVLGS